MLSADFNATTSMEIIGAPASVRSIQVNDKIFAVNGSHTVGIAVHVDYTALDLDMPNLNSLDWKYIDTLPEIQSGYDDSGWPVGDHAFTNNTHIGFYTPVSLYAGDYGFHAGTNVYRGHFNATGSEASFALLVAGGYAFSTSLWLGDQFIYSNTSNTSVDNSQHIYNLSTVTLTEGKEYIFTAVILNNGLDHSWLGQDEIKAPRGVLGWNLLNDDGSSTNLAWKLTGNFQGEDYIDTSRGPLNEGGLYAERKGYHLPGAPVSSWLSKSPSEGVKSPGIGFFSSTFNLDLPSEDYDIPLSISLGNATAGNGAFRGQLYINGWQYGRFSHVGPQYDFYVPEGILNYKGENTIGLSLWALDAQGVKLEDIQLVAGQPVWSGRSAVEMVQTLSYAERDGSY